MQFIASSHNPVFKQFLQLDKKRNRDKQELFIIEGFREFSLALNAGYKAKWIVLNSKAMDSEEWSMLSGKIDIPVYHFSDELFGRIAYRDRVPNILAVTELRNYTLDEVKWPQIRKVVILEAIEKPGNLGAVFRTADAAGIDLVCITETQTDPMHPNVVRASLGSLFTVPFVICSNDELLEALNKQQLCIYTTWLEASVPHFDVDMRQPTAIVLGSEAQGVSPFWVNHAKQCIRIPMYGKVDSMNVSTAAAVLIYEMVRQQKG